MAAENVATDYEEDSQAAQNEEAPEAAAVSEDIDFASWSVRASAWEMCALSLRYPDDELLGAITSGEWCEAAEEIAEAAGATLADDWDSGFEVYLASDDPEFDKNALLHRLRIEATRLFVGTPAPVVSPYEGIWRAKDDGVEPLLFVNPHSMDVERFMKSCGIGQPENKNEPLDNIATECEFLQWICLVICGVSEPAEGVKPPEGSWEAAYRAFFDEHIVTWAPRFARALALESHEAFYRACAAYLTAMIKVLSPGSDTSDSKMYDVPVKKAASGTAIFDEPDTIEDLIRGELSGDAGVGELSGDAGAGNAGGFREKGGIGDIGSLGNSSVGIDFPEPPETGDTGGDGMPESPDTIKQ